VQVVICGLLVFLIAEAMEAPPSLKIFNQQLAIKKNQEREAKLSKMRRQLYLQHVREQTAKVAAQDKLVYILINLSVDMN
jgi:hypothetical protein